MNYRPAALLLLLASFVCTPGHTADPPERVARVSALAGDLTLQNAGSADLSPAFRNWPIASGDRLVTSSGTVAQLSLGTAAVSLEQNADVSLAQLDQDLVQLRILSGAASIHLRELRSGEAYAVQIPNSTVHLLRAGDYRFEVSGDGKGKIVVLSGEAEVKTGLANFQQLTGEVAEVGADGMVSVAHAKEAGDQSTRRPERKITRASTVNHVARGLVGYEDLDDYGTWQWTPEYGMVWEPEVSAEWAPYRFGEWIWKAPWGWTWVDDAPWGFAPFHYGRWVELSTRWYWLPGPRQVTPAYAPALVRWTANPGDESTIGWRPLGPREAYIPPYPASELHVQRLNLFANVRTRSASVAEPTDVDAEAPTAVAWMQRSELENHPPLLR
jgi:hypothetical protein